MAIGAYVRHYIPSVAGGAYRAGRGIKSGNLSDYEDFKDLTHCLVVMGYLYGTLLVAPWALSDIIVAIGSIVQGHFAMGLGHLLLPHAVIGGIGYLIALGIIWVFLPRASSKAAPAADAPQSQIVLCDGCNQKLRVPAGKGQIQIRCPSCGHTRSYQS